MNTINNKLIYNETNNDEVEDLFKAIKDLKEKIIFDSICSGAILSNYQKLRIENICKRLNLKSITPLWKRDQKILLNDISKNIDAIIIKIATPILNKEHIGINIKEINNINITDKYFNWCGEGGEYETLTLDTIFFKKKIIIKNKEIKNHPEEENKEEKVFYLKILEYEIINK